jgi:hypothetical protein
MCPKHSFVRGGVNFFESVGVSPVSLNLSTSLPKFTPQKCVAFSIPIDRTLMTNSPVSSMRPWLCLLGETPMQTCEGRS